MTEFTVNFLQLSALLDILLPGTHGFPPASATGTAARMMTQASQAPLLNEILVATGDDFADLNRSQQIGVVSALEERLDRQFQALLMVVYSEYYTDPAVLKVIAAETGYRHPPQPFGYEMPAFDDSILQTVKNAPSSWRREPVSHSEGKTP